MKQKEKDWVVSGYQSFAEHGPESINVEGLAKKLNRSKSSFYHYFPEREDFLRAILELHLRRTKEVAQKERACKNIDPELLDVLIAHQEDVLFHR
jgi:AcrR family transcriptional regulator